MVPPRESLAEHAPARLYVRHRTDLAGGSRLQCGHGSHARSLRDIQTRTADAKPVRSPTKDTP